MPPIRTLGPDPDPIETNEWIESLDAVLDREGPSRAHFLLDTLVEKARRSGAHIPFSANTAYVNTIPPHLETRYTGDLEVESDEYLVVSFRNPTNAVMGGFWGLGFGGITNDD